jgi:phosphoribosylaminoimidazole-succinocarboxamide synthase
MEAHSGLFSLCRNRETKDFPAAHKANHPAAQRPGSGEDGIRHTARQTVGGSKTNINKAAFSHSHCDTIRNRKNALKKYCFSDPFGLISQYKNILPKKSIYHGGIAMQKLEKLYEGKAKMVFRTDDPELLIVEYKDDATAFNGEKRGTIAGKGVINNRVTNHLMTLLEEQGVPTHFVRELSDRETLVKKVTIVPLEVIVRNISAGSFAKRYGVEEGIVFDAPTIEFSYKNDSLGDPLINSYHALALKLATAEELEQIKALAFRVNDLLKGIMKGIGIDLVDFKLEFGRLPDGSIVLADEISPDTCRLWDETTHEKLDKDRFRRDLGNVEGAYQEIMRRMLGA